MTWFKVDDGFHAHPKAFRAGTAALGLWVRAGSWAASQLTDGFVPAEVVRMYGTNAMAKSLVAAGLWTKVEGGYCFHQWADDGRQPTRQQVEAERAAARERMKKRRGTPSNDPPDSPDVRPNTPLDSGGTSDPVREPRPGPSRPGTYLLTLISRLAAGDARGGPPPAEVIASWQEIAGPGVDLNAEAVSYLSRFGDRPADDERGAWLGWLRKAKTQEVQLVTGPERPGCDRCHGGWLADDEDGRPVPCPTCRPHLRPVQAS
jgi:hypothetical protein